MPDGPRSELTHEVLSEVRRRHWLKPGQRLGVAVSGGADSVALFRSSLELRGELGIVLAAVHFNHTLRGEESEADHAFIRDLASKHGVELFDAFGDVARRAKEDSLSIEAAAREARYKFFWSLLEQGRLDKVATAHTLDDQAETVLLRMIRGTGTRGLGGIHPELKGPIAGQSAKGSIIRPLLRTRRSKIESYLAESGQPWREDSSNLDLHHTRNRIRQLLVPLLEKDFNPEIRERLADLAEITQAEEGYWEETLRDHLTTNCLERNTLGLLPLALQRRLVRAAAPPELQLEFRHVESILEVGAGSKTGPKTYNLPAGWAIQREGEVTRFVSPHAHGEPAQGQHRPIPATVCLPVPGRVSDPSTSRCFEARRVVLANPPAGYNPDHLYAPHVLPSQLIVRTWRFGDRFWPAHTKAPKKLKELFQDKKIPAELRPAWPVMVASTGQQDEVVWVQGFPAPSHLRPRPEDHEAILLSETV